MSELRLIRLGEQIREEISNMIMKQQIKDPRVSTFFSINRVEVAGDLRYAKVYVSSFMNKKETEKGVTGLESAAGFIQTKLSKKLRLRGVNTCFTKTNYKFINIIHPIKIFFCWRIMCRIIFTSINKIFG